MRLADKLLAAADLRRASLDLGDGLVVHVQEPTAEQFGQYGKLYKDDPNAAIGHLLHACVINEDGSAALTADEAKDLAVKVMANHRVGPRILGAIIDLTGIQVSEADTGNA